MSNDAIAVPLAGAAKSRGKQVDLFYPLAACLMLALMLVGFRHFFFEGRSYPGREIPPPIRTLVLVHGVSMALWVVLLVVQSSLIATRRYRMHMTLGRIAAVFAVAIFVTGLMVGVASARITPPDMILFALDPKQFLAVSVFGIGLFAAMVAIGVAYRRRAEVHRPMMLFATLGVLDAAMGRIDAVSSLYQGTAWERAFGPFLGTLVVGLALVIVRAVQTRRFDKWFAASYGLLLAVNLLTIQVARTGAWERFAGLLVP